MFVKRQLWKAFLTVKWRRASYLCSEHEWVALSSVIADTKSGTLSHVMANVIDLQQDTLILRLSCAGAVSDAVYAGCGTS